MCLLRTIAVAVATVRLIVFVNSYHEGYPASDDVMAGIREVLRGAGLRLEVLFLEAVIDDFSREGVATIAPGRNTVAATRFLSMYWRAWRIASRR